MVSLTLCVLVLAAAILYSRRRRNLQHVPSPVGLTPVATSNTDSSQPGSSWLWGHDHIVYNLDVGVAYRQWFDKCGPLLRLRAAFGHPDILVAADLGVTEHILRTNIYDYHHSKTVRPRIERLLGRSLGWVEGEHEHRRMRRLVGTSFSAATVKALTPLINDCAQRISETLVDAVATNAQSNSAYIVNILDWTTKATLEITGRTSFDHDFSAGESADAQAIIGAWRRMATVGISRKGFISLLLLRRFPFLNYIPIKANRAHSVVKTTIQSGVAAAMLARNMGKSAITTDGKDLLTSLMGAHEHGELSTQELLDHISMFIMAGHETTAQTLAYTLWELARHPNVQARLRAELKGIPPNPAYDTLMNELPYLHAVCCETLRVHPALPYMERVATRDDILPLATPLMTPDGPITRIPIRAGQIIVTPIIAIQQQSAVWGTDAAVWSPERWLGELPDPAMRPRGWSGLLAFSDGARACVGWRLGLVQYKALLAALIRRLAFVDIGAEIVSRVASSLQPCVYGEEGAGPQLPVGVTVLV